MRWFSHRRRTGWRHNCRTPPGSHDVGLSAAAACCLQRAHTIRTCPRGVGSAKCIFCPQWPRPLTLTFKLRRDFCTMHLTGITAKCHHRTLNHSEVIVRTNTRTVWQTNRRLPLKTSTSLRYAMAVGKNSPVLNWGCWLTQIDLINGRQMVVVVLGVWLL